MKLQSQTPPLPLVVIAPSAHIHPNAWERNGLVGNSLREKREQISRLRTGLLTSWNKFLQFCYKLCFWQERCFHKGSFRTFDDINVSIKREGEGKKSLTFQQNRILRCLAGSSFHYNMKAWGTGCTFGKRILGFVNSPADILGRIMKGLPGHSEGPGWVSWIKVERVCGRAVPRRTPGLAHSYERRSPYVPEKQKGNWGRATQGSPGCMENSVRPPCDCYGKDVMKQSGDKVPITANIYPPASSADAIQADSRTSAMYSLQPSRAADFSYFLGQEPAGRCTPQETDAWIPVLWY